MAMTKKTLTIYVDGSHETLITPALFEARNNKFNVMQSEGKTDGYYRQVNANTWERHWLDQAAAEEWNGAIVEMTQPYGNLIVSTTISDLA